MLIGYIFHRFGVKSSREYNEVANMKWRTLKSLYTVNPGRWSYEKVWSNEASHTSFNKVLLYETESGKTVRIYLSYFGYVAFIFAKLLSKHRYDKGTQTILDSVQNDIDKLRNEAQKQMEAAQEQMRDIELRLKEK